jgi:hypothetical protein
MDDPNEQTGHRRKSGGPLRQAADTTEEEAQAAPRARAARPETYESVPPEDRRIRGRSRQTPAVVKTIFVRDEQGQIVSVTRVSPDAQFGVGVEPPPGHTVEEVEAGTLAEDPFLAYAKEQQQQQPPASAPTRRARQTSRRPAAKRK